MNMLEVPDASLCVRLAATIGHFLWQGAAVYLLVMLMRLVLRRSSSGARCTVFTAALLVMAACPPVTFVLLRSPVGPATTVGGQSPPYLTGGQRPAYEIDVVPPPGEPELPAVPAEPAAGAIDWWRYAPWLVAGYLAGTALMLGRLVLGVCGGQRLRRRAEPVHDPVILAAFARQARALGMRFVPAIAFCLDVAVPTVVGVLRPMILLPLSAVSGLTTEQIEVLVAHELAHIRRYDHLLNILQRLIEAVLFFHPAVWFVSRRIRVEREHCCDDLVLAVGGKRLAYAESLVRMAELARAGGQSLPCTAAAAAALAAVERPSQLRLRILRLVSGNTGEQVRLLRPAVFGLCVCMMLAVVACIRLTSSRTDARAVDVVPARMVGTWFFENPMGDDEQMAVFPDGRVVVLHSNDHREETRYKDGVIELAEYGNVKVKLLLLPECQTLQTSTQASGLAKLWQRIDAAPKAELLRPLTTPPAGSAATQPGPTDGVGGRSGDMPRGTVEPSVSRAADTQNGLRLSIQVEPTDITEADTLKLVGILENVRSTPIRFFKPRDFDLVSLRNWRFVRSDGKVFTAWPKPFQTAVNVGMQGEILELEGREKRVLVQADVRLLVPAESASEQRYWQSPLPPEPGEYSVSFTHQWFDNRVPFESPGMTGGEYRPIDGLWTGKLESNGVKIVVRPPKRPLLRLSASGEVRVGDPCPITIRVSNPTDQPLLLTGAFGLRVFNMGRSGSLRFRTVPRVEVLADGEVFTLEVPAGESREFELDAAAWPLTPSGEGWPPFTDKPASVRLYDVFNGGETWFQADFISQDGTRKLESDLLIGIFRRRARTWPNSGPDESRDVSGNLPAARGPLTAEVEGLAEGGLCPGEGYSHIGAGETSG